MPRGARIMTRAWQLELERQVTVAQVWAHLAERAPAAWGDQARSLAERWRETLPPGIHIPALTDGDIPALSDIMPQQLDQVASAWVVQARLLREWSAHERLLFDHPPPENPSAALERLHGCTHDPAWPPVLLSRWVDEPAQTPSENTDDSSSLVAFVKEMPELAALLPVLSDMQAGNAEFWIRLFEMAEGIRDWLGHNPELPLHCRESLGKGLELLPRAWNPGEPLTG